ncbi:MAG TPA: glycogen synthase GlgA [Burkholderiales bacterium]|nr:glycogen synthase GlgA [Burkholderiales bacterium]
MRVLYVSTEVYPFVKTGGLADVNAALPPALIDLDLDVRMLLPGLPGLMSAVSGRRRLVTLGSAFGAGEISIWQARLDDVPVYLIDAPELYAREGGPYTDSAGRDWPDNPMRFALLGWIAARFADGIIEDWRPQVVHSHDWHAALAPAYLAARGGNRPASVFTVHNLSFQGQYSPETFTGLKLPPHFFTLHGVEFHGMVNFMKAGLHYADRITTVSPSYAKEIQTPAYGCGMDGVLRSRAGALTGILNGIDRGVWDPATDRHIAVRYSRKDVSGKIACKRALCGELGLQGGEKNPLFAVVSRLTDQKGLDLLLEVLPDVIRRGGRLAVMGTGAPEIEAKFREAVARYPGRVAVHINYDEAFAHRIVAGADVIVVPSRFEPCGLTQMYGLAYGTLPLVRRVGGLADTVRDTNAVNIAAAAATGFVFDDAQPAALAAACARVFELWRKSALWAELRENAMRQNFGWTVSAQHYLEIYRELRPFTAR